MDRVDTLCRLLKGVEVPVPHLNTVMLKGYFAYLTQAEQFADIREWFSTSPKALIDDRSTGESGGTNVCPKPNDL